MNLTDLRDILDERSRPTHAPAGLERMAGVRARVSVIRQRRAAAIAALVVVGAVIMGYGLHVTGRLGGVPAPAAYLPPDPVVTQTTGYRVIDGFPEYADGAKVVATGSVATRVGKIRVSAVGELLGFALAERCQVTAAVRHTVSWTANDKKLGAGTCGGVFRPDPSVWQAIGVLPGQPVDFVATITGAQHDNGGYAPVPDGVFAVAVMSRVPFDQYPLPPRPAQLKPLPVRTGPGHSTVIESAPAQPRAPVQVTVDLAPDTSVDMVAQTPGLLAMYVDGVQQFQAEWWDYDQTPFGATLRAGVPGTRTVTLRLVPMYMTGTWRVVLHA